MFDPWSGRAPRVLAQLAPAPTGTRTPRGRVAHAWTVDALAREAGLSRSALGERFAALLGEPPMRYLARSSMQLASLRLRESRDGVAAIAAEVGYDSEAAFNRAFKRELGVPPAAWRRRPRPPDGSSR